MGCKTNSLSVTYSRIFVFLTISYLQILYTNYLNCLFFRDVFVETPVICSCNSTGKTLNDPTSPRLFLINDTHKLAKEGIANTKLDFIHSVLITFFYYIHIIVSSYTIISSKNIYFIVDYTSCMI